MASSIDTTCPKCGGKAHWNADDGVTYCDEPKCGKHDAYDTNYRPPYYRGGTSPDPPKRK